MFKKVSIRVSILNLQK